MISALMDNHYKVDVGSSFIPCQVLCQSLKVLYIFSADRYITITRQRI